MGEAYRSRRGDCVEWQVTTGMPSVSHMGKMQTAAEDAYRHRDQDDVVVWAATESDVTLISSYVDAPACCPWQPPIAPACRLRRGRAFLAQRDRSVDMKLRCLYIDTLVCHEATRYKVPSICLS
jgi:hypothetical protein